MGVLDDLKKEAAAVEAEKALETTARARAEQEARAQIQPRMQALHRYFTEFKQHLQAISREILARYEFDGVGPVDGLLQGQYEIATEHPEKIDRFSFRCECAKPGEYKVNQADAASVATYRDYLRDNGLKAKARETGRGAALFMVQAFVPVTVEFSADFERVAIRLLVQNLNVIGTSRHTLTLERVDEKFMDEVAKAVLRQPNQFDQLVGIALSETGKLRLKKKIQAAMRQQQIEDELTQRAASRERTITKRFGRTLFGRKD